MKRSTQLACAAALLGSYTILRAGPFEGKTFKGRIAYSADGNHNDQDDWAASPMAVAIFAAAGVRDKVVHFDYNSILPKTDPEWESKHADGVLGAAKRYGYKMTVFHDCRKNLDDAVESIRKAIDDSTAENPLYFIIAGPMEVAYMGIQKSRPEKRKYVHTISHSRWNDGFSPRYTFTHTKRSVIPTGIHWVQTPIKTGYSPPVHTAARRQTRNGFPGTGCEMPGMNELNFCGSECAFQPGPIARTPGWRIF